MRVVRRPPPREELRVLVVRPWTESLAELRAALESSGHDVHIVRVDFEPALNAALAREAFDATIFDPATPGMSRALVETSLRDHGCRCPVIELTAEVADALRRAFVERWN
jgi:CheY-like chemotaxis protein